MKRLTLLAAAVLYCAFASAQGWPTKPVRLICPYPGGPVDLSSRVVAQKLQEALGQPVVVELRPGAGGVIAAEAVAKAAPDGYTLLMGAIATHAINPSLMPNLPYDAMRKPALIGLVKNTIGSPRDSSIARRRFSSIRGPRMKPSSKGAGSHSSLTKM